MKTRFYLAAVAAPALVLCACKREDTEIKSYTVAKEAAPDASGQPAMPPGHPDMGGAAGMGGGGMGGGDPHAGMAGMGGGDPHAGMGGMAGQGGAPSFKVADTPAPHWKQGKLSPMRLACYEVEADEGQSVLITLSTLRSAPGGLLNNVNFWRGQFDKEPLDEAGLKKLPVAKTTLGDGVLVEVEGLPPGADANKDGRLTGVIVEKGGAAWYFKMRGNADLTLHEKPAFLKWTESVKVESVAPAAAPDAAAAPNADGPLTWKTPEGWTQGPGGGMGTYASFLVKGADGAEGRVVISRFPGDVGGDLGNVNRWRGQIGLPPVAESEMAQLVGSVKAGDITLKTLDITGSQNRMLTGWTRQGAETWFFKFSGPEALLGTEKAKFTAFLESVRFTQSGQ